MNRIRFILLTAAAIIFCSTAANAAVWTVTKSANSNDGACNNDCSLREAIAVAGSGDTIVFHPSVVNIVEPGGTEFVINKNLTIDGINVNAVLGVVIINAGQTSRIFYVESGFTLSLKNIVLDSGNAASSFNHPEAGGAIYGDANSVIRLDRVNVRYNKAEFGAGVYSLVGTMEITNSSFTNNSGEACFAVDAVDLVNIFMANVTVSANFQNEAGIGGAVCVANFSTGTFRNVTIADNSATAALATGGIVVTNNSTLNIGNSIVAKNVGLLSNDIRLFPNTTLVSAGGNLIGETANSNVPAGTFTLPGDQTNLNPLLAPINPFQARPVQFHALQAGSPALNSAIPALAVNPATNQPLTTDARGAGFARSVAGVDKGAFEDQTNGNSLIVTKTANSDDNVCDLDCSLREAVKTAGVDPGEDTITFGPAAHGTVNLGGQEIDIDNQAVNIVGDSMPFPIVISGANQSRLFDISNFAAVSISGLTLADGNGTGSPQINGAGAILTRNTVRSLTLDRVIIRDNSASLYGAIQSEAETLRINNSTIVNNRASSNLAIYVYQGAFYMTNTTVTGNFDTDGGFSYGAIVITSTTPAKITNSTIAYNRTADGAGGGIICEGGCNLTLANTIVANNIATFGADIRTLNNGIVSLGGNLVTDTNGFPAGTFAQTNDATGIDPLLAPLADNGGSVPTHLLLPNSPALNAGLNAQAIDPFDNSVLATDARCTGYPRFVGNVDKGAFEMLAPTAAAVSITGRVMNAKGLGIRATVYLTDAQGVTRTARTNNFGYFRFEGVAVGEIYIVSVVAKHYRFEPRVVNLTDELTDLDFTALE